MQWSWLISPLAGSVIGYGTNYLAIKMLFKPHNAKYIGKIKIPFTPGLIPKEKATLANQIGETVEEHLLNEEVLIETLTSDKAKKAFSSLTETILAYIEDHDKTMDDLVKKLLGQSLEESLAKVEDELVEGIKAILESNQIQEAGREIIKKEKICQLIEKHAAHIGKSIIRAIAKGEEADKIKESIHEWAEKQFNPMLMMFINIDKIYDGIIAYGETALDDPDQVDKLAKLLNKLVKEILENENETRLQDQWALIIKTEEIDSFIRKTLQILAKFVGETSAGHLSKVLPKETNQIEERLFEIYTNLIMKNSKTIVDVMDISSLVESKINEFSSQEAEVIILSVVQEQLKGITWIGALLGFIIGLIPNFI